MTSPSRTARIEEIGGTAVKPAGMFSNDEEPVLEWAVMKDPFADALCIIRWLVD